MASIQRRTTRNGTDTFRVGYRMDGQLRWSPTFRDPAAAAELKSMIERIGPEAALSVLDARAGRATTTGMPTLAEYLETHLERIEAHATPGTVADYRSMAERTFLPRLGSLRLDSISADAVRKWVAWQRKQETHRSAVRRARAKQNDQPLPPIETYSPKSIANAQRFLSSVLDNAVHEEGHLEVNPAARIKLPSDHVEAEKVYLTPAEFAAVLAHVPDRWQLLLQTMYGTGMRWGEATALRVGDVQLGRGVGTITVRQAWKKGANGVYLGSPKSRRSRRTIKIKGALVAALTEHLQGKSPDDLVFTGARGARVAPQNFHPRVWHPAVAAAGIGKTPDLHSLRHSHVANLARANVPIKSVQQRLGHESMKTTYDTYGHLFPDADDLAADVAEVTLVGTFAELPSDSGPAALAAAD